MTSKLQAIDENDTSHLTHDDLSSTAILFNGKITPKHYIVSEDNREGIRDWVLSVCIDLSIQPSIPPRPKAVSGDIHEGLYTYDVPQCIVTGYPIPHGAAIHREEFTAHGDDYNRFSSAVGPETDSILM